MHLGIDPGQNGAITAIDVKGNMTAFFEKPSGKLLYEVIKELNPDTVIIEKAQTMPKQGIVSAFNYGAGYGELIAAVNICEVRYYLVSPRRWTSKMLIGTNSFDATKYRSSQAFKRLFPEWAECKGLLNRAGRLHEGVVDAALIGLYGLKHL